MTPAANALQQRLREQDARWERVHDLVLKAREAVRLEIPADQRPADLFQDLQSAIYAIRSRTSLDTLQAELGALSRSEVNAAPPVLDKGAKK